MAVAALHLGAWGLRTQNQLASGPPGEVLSICAGVSGKLEKLFGSLGHMLGQNPVEFKSLELGK